MPKNTSSSSTNMRKRGRPPETHTNEFCSLSNSISLSNYYFGFNIFDIYTPEQLTDLVRNPIENNDILRKVSLMLYGSNGTYTNTVDYMTAMATLDKVIVPHGKNANKRKKNKEIMESTLSCIKDKEIVRDALFKGMVEGVAGLAEKALVLRAVPDLHQGTPVHDPAHRVGPSALLGIPVHLNQAVLRVMYREEHGLVNNRALRQGQAVRCAVPHRPAHRARLGAEGQEGFGLPQRLWRVQTDPLVRNGIVLTETHVRTCGWRSRLCHWCSSTSRWTHYSSCCS